MVMAVMLVSASLDDDDLLLLLSSIIGLQRMLDIGLLVPCMVLLIILCLIKAKLLVLLLVV